MYTYVVLLRGINVGGNNTIAMSQLKQLFESLDFSTVRTYINSGNVLFDTDTSDIVELVTRIEKAILKECGFPVRIIIRSAKSIKKLCKAIPTDWSNDAIQKTDVLFLWDEVDSKKTLTLINVNPEVDTITYISGAIVWNVARTQYAKSGMHRFIGTAVYKHMTARNVNTVRKIGEILSLR